MSTDFSIEKLFQKLYSEFTNFESGNPLIKLLLLTSGIATTVLLAVGTSGAQKIDLLVSLVLGTAIWVLIIYKLNLEYKIVVKKQSWLLDIISFVLSANTIYFILIYFHRIVRNIVFSITSQSDYYSIFQYFQNYPYLITICSIILGLLSMYLTFLIWRKLIELVISAISKLYSELDVIDKTYLALVFIFTGLSLLIIYNVSNAFYIPQTLEGKYPTGVLYGGDTGGVVRTDVYTNIGSSTNAFNQPLFGLFALPFGVLSTVISKLFYFVPNIYYISLQFLQIFALSVSIVLLYRLINNTIGNFKSRSFKNNQQYKKIVKILYYSIVTFSFGWMMNSLMMEQFVLSAFWLILFTYLALNNSKYTDGIFIAASGSTLTNGVLFPFLSHEFHPKKYFKVFFAFLGTVVISGQLPKILDFIDGIIRYSAYTGGSATVVQKTEQWINFIASCFFTPGGRDVIWNYGFEYHVYLQLPVISFNILGIILCCIFIIGLIMNYKDRFTRLCATWWLFSLVLMGIVGFGYGEMFMYSILFAWAYTSLLFISLTRLLKNHPLILCVLLGLIVISLIVVNIPALFDLLSFGVTYYPV